MFINIELISILFNHMEHDNRHFYDVLLMKINTNNLYKYVCFVSVTEI